MNGKGGPRKGRQPVVDSSTIAPRWQAERALRDLGKGAAANALGGAILGSMLPDGTVPRHWRDKLTISELCRRAGAISRRTYFRAIAILEQAQIIVRESFTTWHRIRRLCWRHTRIVLHPRFSDLRKCQDGTAIKGDPKGPSPSVVDLSTGGNARAAAEREERRTSIANWPKLATARSDLPSQRPGAIAFASLCRHCGTGGHSAAGCPS